MSFTPGVRNNSYFDNAAGKKKVACRYVKVYWQVLITSVMISFLMLIIVLPMILNIAFK